MKRYQNANHDIAVPEALRRRVLEKPVRTSLRYALVLATAAVLLATLAAAGAIFFRQTGDTPPIAPLDTATTAETVTPPETEIITGTLPLQLTQVSYPVQAQYPEQLFTEDGRVNDGYDAWRQDIAARRNQPAGYDAGLDEAAQELMRQFLTADDASVGKNRVISPLNLYLALAMLTETTDTTSRAALLDLLGADSIDILRERVAALWTANYSDDGYLTTRLAASFWLNEGISYRADTLDRLARHHYAATFQGKMGTEAMNLALRDWLNDNTGGLLREQADGLSFDPRTVMGLATTIYYQAKWDNEFDPNNTADGIFHASSGDMTLPFMHQSRSSSYYWGDGFAAVNRRLGDGTMWLILPDEGVSPDTLLAREDIFTLMEGGNWENCKHLIVNLAMPKFDVASDMEMISGLTEMGLGDLFSADRADFSPVTDDAALADTLYLSQVKHAARVKVDEEGCEAAAYTVMMMAGEGMPPRDQVDFVLDRPFIFVINSPTGAPLFAGVVEMP